jgi:peptidoglycan hydrolase CwlO-like protein
LAGVGLLGVFTPTALAVDFDAQIDALKGQINQNKTEANQKHAEGNTLQSKVSALNAEISAAQNALNLTRAEIAKTQAEIERQTTELAVQIENLKQNLKAMYKDRDVTPIEVLASSENLSDFVGKQEYMQDLKDKIESNIATVTRLKAELETKKTGLTQKAEQEKAQVGNIASKRSEQQSLLAQTRGEEAAYQNMVKQNEAQLASVFAARAEAIRRSLAAGGSYRAGGQCGGGYPDIWCRAAQDSMVDDYGYYNRECVSYAAWKRDAIGRTVPRYWGNANQWWVRGSAGVTPAYGDIVAWPDGPWGHVAIVESNNGDSITISEYNYSPRGGFSTRTIPNGQLGNVRYIK